jgi:hypothetical protein
MNSEVQVQLSRYIVARDARRQARTYRGKIAARRECHIEGSRLIAAVKGCGRLNLMDPAETRLLMQAVLDAAGGWVGFELARKTDGGEGKEAGTVYRMPVRSHVTVGVVGSADPALRDLEDARTATMTVFAGPHGAERKSGFRRLNLRGLKGLTVSGRHIPIEVRG